MKFRKKPVVIEAIQFTHCTDWRDGPDWFTNSVNKNKIIVYNTGKFHDPSKICYAEIFTLEGVMLASELDWIIKGINGEIYPCKPDIFEKTYEKVEE